MNKTSTSRYKKGKQYTHTVSMMNLYSWVSNVLVHLDFPSEKWIRAAKCKVVFSYEWFDRNEKLEHKRPAKKWKIYSHLKGEGISDQKYEKS